MDFSLPRKLLLRALDAARTVADSSSSMPILKTVHVAASRAEITLTASDLVLTYRATLPAAVRTAGSVCVPAGILRDVVARMGDGDVRIAVEKTGVTVRGQGVRAAAKLPAIPGEDYVTTPRAEDLSARQTRTMPASALADVRRLTRCAMSTDSTRPHLAATLFDLTSDTLRAVTTDGHRLVVATREIPRYTGAAVKLLVPAASLARMSLPDAGDITIEHGTMRDPIWVTCAVEGTPGASVTWSTKLVDAAFPSYEQVVPQSWSGHVECARADLIDALSACASVAQDRTGGVRLRPRETGLAMDSENPDAGSVSDVVDAICTGVLPKCWGVNSTYMIQALSALTGDRVKLQLSGALDPARIVCADEGDRYVAVIMGMRTGESE